MRHVAGYLDERRIIGTRVRLLPVRLRGVSVVVDVIVEETADPVRVEQDVAHALYVFFNPLIGGSAAGPGAGWPFGRPLHHGELFGVVHAIAGVEAVNILRVYEANLETGEQQSQPAGTRLVLEPDEVVASSRHVVKAEPAGAMSLPANTDAAFGGPGFGTLLLPVIGEHQPAPPAVSGRGSCAARCRPSTSTTTSQCASSARSSTCSIPIAALLDGLPAHV